MISDNILDTNEFDISNYLHNKRDMTISEIEKINMAKAWAVDANTVIITPTSDLLDLETQWINFNNTIKKKRRESDWKSLEIFGLTNQEHYDQLKSNILKKSNSKFTFDTDIDGNPISLAESYVDNIADSYYSSSAINYTPADVEKARDWGKESDRIIIIPTRTLAELEELWDSFNSMIKKHRRESDWISTEIFGVTNLRHYEFLKNQFLKNDVKDVEEYGSLIEGVTTDSKKRYYRNAIKDSMPDTVKSLIEESMKSSGVYEDVLVGNVLSDITDKYDSDLIAPSDIVDNIICNDMPYIDPEEMIDKGVFGLSPIDNYYGAIADNSMINDSISVKEWFEIYRSANMGLYTEFSNYSADWVNKVQSLLYELNLMKDVWSDDKIRARKQSILELGWDPDVEFTTKARLIAKEMASFRMKSDFSNAKYKIVDFKSFDSNIQNSISETKLSGLKPVYIVMIEGKSYFAKAIKFVTKDIYSHVAISFDHELHNMYSYGIATNETSNRSGFRREDIKDLPVGGRIQLFAFFVSDAVYKKITDFVEKFKENAEKTDYSFRNLITYIFNIPYNTEWKLVCSQFVDRCLKSAGIDLVKRDSSQISPSDLNKELIKENRIYELYQGIHEKYNPSKIKNLMSSLSTKAVALKESIVRLCTNETTYLATLMGNIYDISSLIELKDYSYLVNSNRIKTILENILFDSITIRPIGEAKEFPIQFDKEGNLLIKNLKKIDYEAEYSKSHKLLKEYDKKDNIEGMKYELSKLWMMICMIEDKLHSKKFKNLPSFAIESSGAHKARAKIINDFKYYMERVLKKEPEFNFTEYYEHSPFSSAATKINAPTLSFMGKMITKFIKSI